MCWRAWRRLCTFTFSLFKFCFWLTETLWDTRRDFWVQLDYRLSLCLTELLLHSPRSPPSPLVQAWPAESQKQLWGDRRPSPQSHPPHTLLTSSAACRPGRDAAYDTGRLLWTAFLPSIHFFYSEGGSLVWINAVRGESNNTAQNVVGTLSQRLVVQFVIPAGDVCEREHCVSVLI